MTFLARLFARRPDPREACRPLYDAVVAHGRDPSWYLAGVPDTVDGRFDMIAAVLAQVLLRLEGDEAGRQPSVHLAELFIDDMDGQLRQKGVGDVSVGKHIGKMMGALGGRLTAYRVAGSDPVALREAIERNVWRGGDAGGAGDVVTAQVLRFIADCAALDSAAIIGGRLPALRAGAVP